MLHRFRTITVEASVGVSGWRRRRRRRKGGGRRVRKRGRRRGRREVGCGWSMSVGDMTR